MFYSKYRAFVLNSDHLSVDSQFSVFFLFFLTVGGQETEKQIHRYAHINLQSATETVDTGESEALICGSSEARMNECVLIFSNEVAAGQQRWMALQ